jgi:putative ABC transport system permease protein
MRPFRRLPHAGTTRRSIERDVDAEIRFHLQMRVEDLMRQGRSRDEAEREAVREYGDMTAARSELASIDRRAARNGAWREWLATIGQDIRFGLRGLRSRPGFTLTVLVTLALGIGANAAIFSVVDAVLLRPLPFTQPDRLVHLWEVYDSRVDGKSEASYPDYLDWRARTKAFADLAGYQGGRFLLGGAQPATLAGGRVTSNFFDLLGVRAMVGRTFVAGEDAVGAPRVVVLAYGFWQRQFAGDRDIVGKPIVIDGAPATVVGVLPRTFSFARQGSAEVWMPVDRPQSLRERRGSHWLNTIARLKPDVTIAAAYRDMSSIMRDLAREYPATNTGRDAKVVPLQEEFVGSVTPTLRLLYWSVVVVLLIACVNVANLLLIRGADRQREIAVRVALGAGRGRLIRQLLTESMLLAVLGGVLGLGVAQIGVHSLLGLIPARAVRGLPMLASAGLDARVITYTLLVSLLAGLGFGLVPALRLRAGAVHDSLKSASRGSTGGAARLRDSLVVAEVALTVILMSGALLFGRSLIRLLDIDPGFRVERLVSTNVVLPVSGYRDSTRVLAFYQRFTDALQAVPGVSAVGFTSKMPLDFGNSASFAVAGRPAPQPGNEPSASYRQVTSDYFTAMGIPTISGRVFGTGDVFGAPQMAVVNRAFVSAYFENQNPLGQALVFGADTVRIAGVVGDVPIGNLGDAIPPTLYLAFAQMPQVSMALALRTSLDRDQAARAIRQALTSLEPSAALTPVATMETILTDSPSVFMRRFPLFLVGAFAITALLLAVVGIYGVVSYSVAQRQREMGIRMALGAQPRSLVGLVVRHGGWMAIAGIVIGVGASLLLGRFAESLLFGVKASDPLTYASVAAALAVVAVAATVLPARRATRVDPALALRAE